MESKSSIVFTLQKRDGNQNRKCGADFNLKMQNGRLSPKGRGNQALIPKISNFCPHQNLKMPKILSFN